LLVAAIYALPVGASGHDVAVVPNTEGPQPDDIVPEWSAQPSDADIAANYPQYARRKRLSGAAAMRCSVAGTGKLFGCRVVRENPGDGGFGEALWKLAPLYRMRVPPGGEGVLKGRTVRIEMRFALPARSAQD
jgi:TonB family protein